VTRLYLSPPHVTGLDRRALLDAFDSGWIAPVGPELEAFESALCERVGVGHAVALSSGTAALHLALLVLGVGPADEVLVSDLTFAAPANAVRYLGATPVFVDSQSTSWNVDPALVVEALEARTALGRRPKALIAVDLYGQVADFEQLRAACDAYDVPIIEDAAEALGATYGRRPAGGLGDLGVFSFNGNKIVTTSGGGALVSDRKEWVERARHLSTQAREPVLHYEHEEVGYNYRLSNLLAALGRSQLADLDQRVKSRRAVNAAYRAALGHLPGVGFMPDAGSGLPSWWLTCITVDPTAFGAARDDVRVLLDAHDIEARPTWKPMHLQGAFAGAPVFGGTVGESVFERGLCLPSGSALTAGDVERVAGLVASCAR
jgi:dTDP-4-amino-4,6-dideoxygalactose transaminase